MTDRLSDFKSCLEDSSDDNRDWSRVENKFKDRKNKRKKLKSVSPEQDLKRPNILVSPSLVN